MPLGGAGGDRKAVLSPRMAYGEMKAPAEVDTLRDENCPVCGEQDAWDGAQCAVCGFVAPPSKFQDPDVDTHKQLDLRQDQQDGGGNPLEQSLNDADRDGLNDASGMPVDDQTADEEGALDQQPQLICSNCGEQFEAGHPISTNTAMPQDGDSGADGPAEGDVCPACGQGLLENGTEAAEMGQNAEADPNAVPDEDPDPHADEEGLTTDSDGDGIPDGEDPDPKDPDNPIPNGKDDSDPDFQQQTSDSKDDDASDDEDDDSDDDDDDKPVGKNKIPFKRWRAHLHGEGAY